MLVYKLFEISIYIFIAIWIFGWFLLMLLTLLPKLFPKSEQSIESFLQRVGDKLSFVQTVALITAGVLFVIRLLARWFWVD